MSNEGALAALDVDAALAQLASGRMLKQIADDFKCSKVAVYKRLHKHPEYPAAIAQQAEAFVEQAMTEVMTCDADTVNIARARVDAAFKWAAARDPARWGPKQQADAAQITVVISRDAVSITQQGAEIIGSIDGECAQVSQATDK